jgi:hypothetical protein
MRVKFEPGAVLKFRAGEEDFAFALMLETFPYIAFYGYQAVFVDGRPPSTAPMFVTLVERAAYSTGRWGRPVAHVGRSDLPPIPRFFWQSPVNKFEIKIVEPGKRRYTASADECEDLEPEAIWSAEHIESRIVDMYLGRPSAVFETVRLKR